MSASAAMSRRFGAPLVARVAVSCLGGLLGAGSCDGGQGPGAPRGRYPEQPGAPLPVCGTTGDCPDDTGCVPWWPGVGERGGRCVPRGAGGGPCRGAEPRCDPGLTCAGKEDTCVPLLPAGQSCLAAACQAPALCDRFADAPLCALPGAPGGPCRARAPRCDGDLGCVSGAEVCAPLHPEGLCFDSRRHHGCPDGMVCPHHPGDLGSAPVTCARPGVAGGVCGDPALGRPECAPGLGCAGGTCRADALWPGQDCIPGTGHAPCVDGAVCEGRVCQPLGRSGRACRPRDRFAEPCDPGFECDGSGRCQPRLDAGQDCDPSPLAEIPCRRGTSCVARAGAPARCLVDGELGGRCASGTCAAPGVCARARDGGTVCRMGLPAGAPCTQAREPFEPCVAGHHCDLIEQRCTADGQPGAACTASGACAAGATCAFNGQGSYCYPDPPVVATGQACDDSAVVFLRRDRCPDRQICLGGRCRAEGEEGAPCRARGVAAPRCDPGLACVAGRCAVGKVDGQACARGGDSECGAPLLCVGDGLGGGRCTRVPGYVLAAPPRARPLDACGARAGGELLEPRAVGEAGTRARDDGQARVTLPFPFPLWGETHVRAVVAVDGLIAFPGPGEVLSGGSGGNGALPAPQQPALLAPLWDDLYLSDEGRLCMAVQSIDGVPSVVLFTWKGLRRYGRPGVALTFSVALHASGAIEFDYGDLWGTGEDGAWASGARAAIGLQSAGGVATALHVGPAPRGGRLRWEPRATP